MSDLIENIKEGLKSLGWSESKLSRETGIPQPTINRYLAGIRGVSEENLNLIADALEAGFSARIAELEAELAAKEEVANRLEDNPTMKALRPEAAAIKDAAVMSKIKLANSVLFATGRYIGPDTPDGIAEIAAERIYGEFAKFIELMKAGHSTEEICRALGIYIARLEVCYARLERRIADLENQ
ncbi:helix-turn-helix domain-containing protein [Edaphobacter aggregans]|uniref:helix-turn-helix domain-containing protein n=1 Tax=Edaphobacter aggregans TaxID=570835 RepID=UPI00055562A3|nr:helix-turn-helix transcriptional regulator [Edaphobacter aggregans]